jgi:hypothetical protein
MRLSQRPRHYVSPVTLTVCRPLLAHDWWRDAYLLRGVGERYGPVLRAERRREEEGYAGPERRAAPPTAVSRGRGGLTAVIPVLALGVAALVAVLLLAGHGKPAAAAAPVRVTTAASVRGPSVTTQSVSAARIPAPRRVHPRPAHRARRAHRAHRAHQARSARSTRSNHRRRRARRVRHRPVHLARASTVAATAPSVTNTLSAAPPSTSDPASATAPTATYSAPVTATPAPTSPTTSSSAGGTAGGSSTTGAGSGTVHGGSTGSGGSGTVHGGG